MQTADVTAAQGWFIGTNRRLRFAVTAKDGVTPVDVSTWTLQYLLQGPDFLLVKNPPDLTIEGTFSTTANQQRVVLTVTAAESVTLRPGIYLHSVWRTDPGFEDVLAAGRVTILSAVPRVPV